MTEGLSHFEGSEAVTSANVVSASVPDVSTITDLRTISDGAIQKFLTLKEIKEDFLAEKRAEISKILGVRVYERTDIHERVQIGIILDSKDSVDMTEKLRDAGYPDASMEFLKPLFSRLPECDEQLREHVSSFFRRLPLTDPYPDQESLFSAMLLAVKTYINVL